MAAATLALFFLPFAAHFEVASLKPSADMAEMRAARILPHVRIEASRVDIALTPLSTLIALAYNVESWQLTAPEWTSTQRFDIVAKLPAGASTSQVPEMLRALLEERFHLTVRSEAREQPVYHLVVANAGAHLKEAVPEAATAENPFPDGLNGRLILSKTDHRPHGWQVLFRLHGAMLFEGTSITMPDFATALKPYANLPVADKTGLPGMYEISIPIPIIPNGIGSVLVGDGDAPADPASELTGVSMSKSLETLGLRLEKSKASLDHLIVEHVDKTPSGN